MRLNSVGKTGLRVSELGLGTMTWGRDTDEHDAQEQLELFMDAGGSLISTAASYSQGGAEELLGSMLAGGVDRRDLTICSKSGTRRTAGGQIIDASRGALLDDLDGSLARIGTDHLDVWLVQAPDRHTPLEETAGTLAYAVKSGRARYVGLSNHSAWQIARVATLLESEGVVLAATESEYSLVERSVEREIVPAAVSLGFGIFGWSALGRGVLTGKYRFGTPADSRAASPHLAGFVEQRLNAHAQSVVEAVATAASGLGCSPLDVALAWLRTRTAVASAVVGARTAAQLRGSLAALDVELPPELLGVLDEVSQVR